MRAAFIDKLIAFIERILRVDFRYLFSGGFFLSLTQVTSAIASLALTIAFANLLPVDTYGTYKYVLAVYALLAIATLPGIDTAVSQSAAKGFDSALKDGTLARMRWGLLGTFASLLYAGYLYMQGSAIMGHIFVVVAIALPLMESFSLFSSFLNAKRLFRTSAIIDVLSQAVSASFLIGSLFLTKNIVIIIGAYFLPYIAVRILASIYVATRHVQPGPHDKGLVPYGRSMTIFQIISRLIASADQIVLYHFLGPASVALFSLATAIPNRINSLFRITGTLAFPKFANRTGAEIAESLPRKMLVFALGVLAMCGVYIAAAPFLFTYVFPQYLPSLPYSQVAVFFTLSAITYPFGSFLMAHKKVRDSYLVAITSFVTKIACLAGFVPFFGIWGAVIGILATSAVTIGMSAWLINRERTA